jgi:hypothetical protein
LEDVESLELSVMQRRILKTMLERSEATLTEITDDLIKDGYQVDNHYVIAGSLGGISKKVTKTELAWPYDKRWSAKQDEYVYFLYSEFSEAFQLYLTQQEGWEEMMDSRRSGS